MLTFKKAKLSDIITIQALATEIWHTCYNNILTAPQIEYMLNLMYSETTIQEELENKILWELILLENQVIGFISVTTDQNTLKLNKLYIKDQYHGKGIGKLALAHVIDFGIQNKFERVYLTVNKKNSKAIKAYEKAGFVNTHSAVTDIGMGYVMDDYIYVYSIPMA